MKTRYRIVKLRNGKYARQWRSFWTPWFFTSLDDDGDIIKTFDTVTEAENYERKPLDIVEIVKEL